MIKIYSVLATLLVTASATVAQQYDASTHLIATVVSGTTNDFKAVNTLTAVNRIESEANAHYVAGKSVTLEPGFVAMTGAVFSASIEAVVSTPNVEGDKAMTVVVYPNPFSDAVSIGYSLPTATAVKQTLTDASGKLIRETGGREIESFGAHRIDIKGDGMPTGVYFLQLQTDTERRVIRLLKK